MSALTAVLFASGLASVAQATSQTPGGIFQSGFGCWVARIENRESVGGPFFINLALPKKLIEIQENDTRKIGVYDPSRLMEGTVAGFDRIVGGADKGAYFFYGSTKVSESSPVLKVFDGRVSNRSADLGPLMEYQVAVSSHGQFYQGLCTYTENEQVANALESQQFWRGGGKIQ